MTISIRGYKGKILDIKSSCTNIVKFKTERPIGMEINWYTIKLLIEAEDQVITVILDGVKPEEISYIGN